MPPRDAGAMADKLVLLLKDEGLRARMGRAALARALDAFTVERMVARHATLYRELLD